MLFINSYIVHYFLIKLNLFFKLWTKMLTAFFRWMYFAE